MEETKIKIVQQIIEGPTTSTTRPVEERSEISHTVEVMGERRIVKLTLGVIAFPSTKMQEKVHTLSHFDLVLSQISGEMLQGLQDSIEQELNLHVEKTSDKLAKDIIYIASMHIEYNRFERERDASMKKKE
jgi:hypothetical protein